MNNEVFKVSEQRAISSLGRCDISELARAVAQTGVSSHVLGVGQSHIAVWETPDPQSGLVPIILIHGASYSSQSVFNLPYQDKVGRPYSLMQGLHQSGIYCFAFDMSGYGGSSDCLEQSDIATYVRELSAVVDHVVQRTQLKPVVVGWSWGGEVAGQFTQDHQDRIAGLVLWGTPWCGGDSDLKLKGPSAATFDEPRRLNTRAHSIADFRTPKIHDQEVVQGFSKFARWVDSTAPNVCIRALQGDMPLFDPQRLKLPTMLLYGAGDPVYHSSDPSCLLEALGSIGKSMHVLEASDHASQFSKCRRELWQVLRKFTETLTPGTGTGVQP